MLTRQQKEAIVKEMTEIFKRSSLALFADFTGFTVADLTELRSRLREKYNGGARFKVVKNTLLTLSLKDAGYEGYEEFLKGPTAVLYVTDGDPVEAVKIIYNFYKEKNADLSKLKGGFLEGRKFSSEEVEKIAKLPSKEELYAMLVGRVKAPISGLVFVLSGILRNLVLVLNAVKEKKSE
ncbi:MULTISPECIES: 50S ribosomal protein L10 [Thermotoga]|uniref:Large ribosomal subunit protein uL10 n=1 Tax=Thermotoga neapolitana (strain ATCC 49049 / DSM 4359 / NBRC 107923 / NS-E) TaxID=309803 RepID=RL10_THENN|nr:MULTISPECIES: 50S ribosomal protein L10 [Thermotoga]B9KBJ7.1 RecName: Full=Large ribosomal subunit protein uL10; AltName: Full=50S ribosomal protein L10 [Thermotoga neapolitana DSM 4359]MDK2786170.1 large subunit ribosomal protein [Thermotoga sp.]HBF11208.1 50S ribosomal protein L10 [Thermotoga neapolitana]ACM22393.1 50S ribosomal protein L10 [Thermotoga neapolitana DSM 4359]AJG40351.1 50S ribosomal protein L10 [Thermotoga sp. RQ7]KFZ22505.1 50S ribosomal protein L10 [Thermotoga neapolitan